MNTPATTQVHDLRRDHPEWSPWLTVVRDVLREALGSSWERFVPALSPQTETVPLLANAVIEIPRDHLGKARREKAPRRRFPPP